MGVKILRLQFLLTETHRTGNSDSVKITNIGLLNVLNRIQYCKVKKKKVRN